MGSISYLDRDGFVIAERLLDDETIDNLLFALDTDARATKRRAGRSYSARNLLSDVSTVRAIALGANVRALAENAIGAGAFPVRALFFDKSPEANWHVGWHQDTMIPVAARRDAPGFGSWSVKAGTPHVRPPASVLERMVTLRIHLDDCTRDAGPLRVVPGSHRRGFIEGDEIMEFVESSEPQELLVHRGDIVVMMPLLLHGSSRANEPTHRRVLHIEYAIDGLPGGLAWPTDGEVASAPRIPNDSAVK